MPATVEIYTRPGCGYCSAAKSLLMRKTTPFTEYDVSAEPNRRGEMIARAGGGSTYPQIFIDAVHVGGCDDLHALERAGKLDSLLAGRGVAP